MNTQTHPAVHRYLAELADLLTDSDPAERAEVLAGVREHVDDALADLPEPTDDQVQAVLTGLGSPAVVAREALPAGHRPSVRASVLDREWVPIVAALCQFVGLFLLLVWISGTTGVSTSSTTREGPSGVVEDVQVHYDQGSSLGAALYGLLGTLPVWLVLAVLIGLSSLWGRREKLLWLALIPGSAVLMGGLPDLGWAMVGEQGIYTGAWIGLALVVLGGGWLTWRLTARGRDRAR